MGSHPHKVAIIGLGYVGLPVALAMATQYDLVGFDINEDKVAALKSGIDPNNEVSAEKIKSSNIVYTSSVEDLLSCNIYIVAVPTPVDVNKVPDLSYLKSACKIVAGQLREDDLVIFESTVYPGCTEEVCVPLLEKISGLSYKKHFKVGYSPERIVPGVGTHQIEQVIKVVSGCDEDTLDKVAALYASVIKAGIHKAESIKVAEAAKIVENTQRNVNIALMNELSMIFDKLDIDTAEVLKAAGTKWNFHNYYPGLVGGHCIDVDPYYLTHKAELAGYSPEIILASKKINSKIPVFITKKIVKHLLDNGKVLSQSKILIKGITFKENVSDHRNSKVADLYNELKSYNLHVDVTDPLAHPKEIMADYGIGLLSTLTEKYDVLILAVAHDQYVNENWSDWKTVLAEKPIIFDVKSVVEGKNIPNEVTVLSL